MSVGKRVGPLRQPARCAWQCLGSPPALCHSRRAGQSDSLVKGGRGVLEPICQMRHITIESQSNDNRIEMQSYCNHRGVTQTRLPASSQPSTNQNTVTIAINKALKRVCQRAVSHQPPLPPPHPHLPPPPVPYTLHTHPLSTSPPNTLPGPPPSRRSALGSRAVHTAGPAAISALGTPGGSSHESPSPSELAQLMLDCSSFHLCANAKGTPAVATRWPASTHLDLDRREIARLLRACPPPRISISIMGRSGTGSG